ncbi:NAD(P)-dependent oxidoreductase [Mesorhizobium sp. CN2-181]|uniref:NAD-dependent epimerase/dehydratase family protein n=1 Tax=Mesorhizobium yinganensis TaxID=3157707 RepID=UPI0032B700B9
MSRILLTGAAGRLGTYQRRRFAELELDVLATDIVQPPGAPPLEIADFCDPAQVARLMQQDISAVVHLGGVANEQPWQAILSANIVGTYNIFEGARLAGVRRIVYASSYHAVGMYPVDDMPVDTHAALRPDSLYGLSKGFGETLARLYHDKFGIESMSIRICTALRPKTERELHLYCNQDDLFDLVRTAIEAPRLGCKLVYGISERDGAWCVNDEDQLLGWEAKHRSSELPPPGGNSWPSRDPSYVMLGGVFGIRGHPDDLDVLAPAPMAGAGRSQTN